MSKHSCVDRLSTSPCGLHPASRRRRPPTHRGDEPVQRLPSLRVLDRDGAQVVAEPDGGDDAARVAVGDVLLQRNERKARVRDSDSNRVSRGMWEWAAQGPRQPTPPRRVRLHGPLLSHPFSKARPSASGGPPLAGAFGTPLAAWKWMV